MLAQFGQHGDEIGGSATAAQPARGAEIAAAQRSASGGGHASRHSAASSRAPKPAALTGTTGTRTRKRSKKASPTSSSGTSLVAPMALISGQAGVRTVVEFALVEQREQGVEDGAVGLEHLVDEGDRGIGQEAVGVTLVAVFFQRRMDSGPNSSSGTEKRVSRRSK
jgi:hypothetical protein